MGEVNEFCFFYAGESWTSPFSLGLSFPTRALDWMAVIVPPISGCMKVVNLGGLERLGVCVCVRSLWVALCRVLCERLCACQCWGCICPLWDLWVLACLHMFCSSALWECV